MKEVKFLFGEPSSASTTASGETERIKFFIGEEGLTTPSIDEVMEQREWAKRCAEWVGQDSVEVRTIAESNFMHGKMYHMNNAKHGDAAVVGSSNLTKRGLGAASKPNIELNISTDEATHAQLQEWFDEIWRDETLTKDAKEALLAALARWHEEYSPEFLYYKTLFELFKEELDARDAEDENLQRSHLYDSQIWKALYEFQKDGAKSVIARLLRHKGCILADSVGLGKTYTALAVIKYFELRNERVLVLCPKRLEQNWSIYRAAVHAKGNPFLDDRFSYVQLAHTDLDREEGMAGIVDLANFNWSGFDLVVIDESHNFRNQSKTRVNPETGKSEHRGRYEKLIREVIASGSKTKVLLLSATPVNTSLRDLRNQVYLMTEGQDDAFAETLQIDHIRQMFNYAEKQFKQWEAGASQEKSDLLGILGGDFLRLLSALTVARSRKQITAFYGEHIKEHGKFPKRADPINENPHTDVQKEFTYEEIFDLIDDVKFHIYQPSDYVSSEEVARRLQEEKERLRFNQRTREMFLTAMMRINYLKRFESSAEALCLTLRRTLDKIDAQDKRITKYIDSKKDGEADPQTDGDGSQDEGDAEDLGDYVVNSKSRNPYRLSELNVVAWREDMRKDRTALEKILAKVGKVTPERDGKWQLLKEYLRRKTKEKNRKILIFTTFADTANYLYARMEEEDVCKELGARAALVTGSMGKNRFTEVLDAFAPTARKVKVAKGDEIDILIATDCISEGQNLQDCDTVLNYDIHWNPVRIIQRFGRIDRIGSKSPSVHMVSFWPHPKHEEYLKLRSRVNSRMALLDATATGDDDPLKPQEEIDRANKEEIAESEKFRYKLALDIRDGHVDIEDMQNTVAMGDLTLDYFLTQLLRYLQEHREELAAAPPGVYAVTDAATGKTPAEEGVIFLFQQINTAERGNNSPTYPFYLVHAVADGVRRYHIQANEILRLFEGLALPHKEPLLRLCDTFVAEIKTPKGRAAYRDMAEAAVSSIEAKAGAGDFARAQKDGNILIPREDERPQGGNLQLITWLVIRRKQ